MKKIFFVFVLAVLMTVLCLSVCASSNLLVDNAGLLTANEAQNLKQTLQEYSDCYGIDIVVVTENSIGNKSAEAYADDYFDYNGYGRGSNRDGVLLLLDMGTRSYHISTSGGAIYAISDYGLENEIEANVVPYLSQGRYYEAFSNYARKVAYLFDYLSQNGEPYDIYYGREGRSSFPWKIAVAGGAGIGLIITLITLSAWKKQLTPVALQTGANDYIRKNSFNLMENSDLFLYKNVTKRYNPPPPPPSSSSGGSRGGSSTHHSSSGRSHGGGGGHF